jgi:hypothetical protein
MPMIRMFIGDKTIRAIEIGLHAGIAGAFPRDHEKLCRSPEGGPGPGKDRRGKNHGLFNRTNWKPCSIRFLTKEFRFVEVIGAVLGFLIGLLQILFTLLLK